MDHQGTKKLETDRLILRRFEINDAEDMYKNVTSDSAVNKFLTWKLHESITETVALISEWNERYRSNERYCWAIVLKEIGEVIGTIAVPTIKKRTETVEVTYCIGSNWWGQGIVVEALHAVIDYLFDIVKVNRIEAGFDVNNPNSGRVMEKVGMKKEGILRQGGCNNQGLFDIVFYAILRKEWLSLRRIDKSRQMIDGEVTPKIKQILNNLHKYNINHMAKVNFGLSEGVVYDALVVAPSYSPYKVITDKSYKITETGSQSYCTGYEVERDNLKIAWIKTAAGGCNLLDYLLICGELQFKKLIFIGAVGALKEEFHIGDICTPSYSVAGTLANTYLKDSIKDYVPFEKVYPDIEYVNSIIKLANENNYKIKKASVFCTDSIAMEYTHLEEIKSFGTDLIEMETSTFYAVAKLMEIPSIALLVVSDNSATGVPLVGRGEEVQKLYEHSRKVVLIDLIYKITKA